jgi:hypothetical protein
MAYKVYDFVQESSTSTGTGNFVTSGVPTAGFGAFSARYAVGDTFPYSIAGVDSNNQRTGEAETGIGTVVSFSGSAMTWSRAVISSSNADALVSFSAGTKLVSVSLNAVEMRLLPTRTLAADYTNSTTTVTSTGLTFDAEASADYEIEILGEFSSAATTTGIGFAFTTPTGSTQTGQWVNPSATTQAATLGWQANSSGVVAAKTSGTPTGTLIPVWGRFHVRTSTTAGTVTLGCASEVASSLVTLKAGFMMKVRRYN